MREIIFRGKRIDNGEWVYGFYTQDKENDELLDCIIEINYCDWYVVIPSSIGQYTGLKDRNGTKIFEGDVVRCWIDVGMGGEIEVRATVDIEPFGVSLQEWTFKEDGYLPTVIGNIHETREEDCECQ